MQRRAAVVPPHVMTGESPPKTILTEDEENTAVMGTGEQGDAAAILKKEAAN